LTFFLFEILESLEKQLKLTLPLLENLLNTSTEVRGIALKALEK